MRLAVSALLGLSAFFPAARVVDAVSPFPQQVGSQELQCEVYALAAEFGAKVQPGMTAGQKQFLADALTLPACLNGTYGRLPAHVLGVQAQPYSTKQSDKLTAGRRSRRAAFSSRAGSEIFVDPVHGSDSNDGSKANPLQTIDAAVALSRKAASTDKTITLRGGVYFLQKTVALTPDDTGLTIQSFQGEVAELTGTAPIAAAALKWEEYKVDTNASTTMSAVPNMNMVYGATFGENNTHISYAGKTSDAQTCSDFCLGSDDCDAFTWHDPQQPAGDQQWDNMCYFVRHNQAIEQHPQTHHFSGIKQVRSPSNVWVARGAASNLPNPATGLRVNGMRAIRARWPNGDPEYQLFPDGWEADVSWAPPIAWTKAPEDIVVNSPNRSDEGPCSSVDGYCFYATGVGGRCADYGYEPPSGYWCASQPPRGAEYSTQNPSALSSGALGSRSWPNWKPNETVINAFRQGHWFSYVFLTDSYKKATDNSSATLSWTTGGFQGGEGCNTAAEFNIENSLDELDAPAEWYLDIGSGDLYFFPNNTEVGTPPPSSDQFAVTQLDQLITITGAGSAAGETGAHVANITLSGLKLTGTSMTTLAPHGLPSDGGGDWAIARFAAINIVGAEGVTIDDCLFERLDGNGIMISGYARNTTIRNNEFHLIGENGVVSWGYTADFPNTSRTVPIPVSQGPDARDGNHPQGNVLQSNFFHEIGHFQKQVSCYFQAQTQMTTLSNNVCFNGPRAGINFNDGMGGGNLLENNLIFNMVRETQDHGTFNSWNRQPFFVKRDEYPNGTYIPLYTEIKGNFWMNDYNSQEAVDNDDGSCYYSTHDNFFPFSDNGLKNDFGGHDNRHFNNVYINTRTCMGVNPQKPDHLDAFYNNTCIIFANSPNYASYDTKDTYGPHGRPIMHDNQVFTLDGKVR
eukprot:INCI9889.3.p1 GENE.INCI9889.3~~INCI9889.3.p1  ORF type:complete len:911 (+),score=132.78 INCI9889.3:121-2853(+)